MPQAMLDSEQIESFHRDGHAIAREFYDLSQMSELYRIAKAGFDIDSAYAAIDPEGKSSRLLLRNDLPDDIYSALVRGSHRCGRLNHSPAGGQLGSDGRDRCLRSR